MKNHKIVVLLKELSSDECKRLVQFLHSPYFNKVERLVILGEYLLSFYPTFDSEAFTEGGVFQVVFGEKKYNKHELTRYLSKLIVLIEEFVVAEALQRAPFLKGELKADYFYKTQNTARFTKAQRSTQKLLETSHIRESANYFNTYLNQKQAHDFWMQKTKKTEASGFFRSAIHALNTYFFIETLQAAITLAFQHRVSNIDEELPLLEPTMAYIHSHTDRVPPLVQLWYFAYLLLRNPKDENVYNQLKRALQEHVKTIPAVDGKNFSIILKSAIKAQASQGRKRYLNERFSISQLEIEEGWIIADGVVNYHSFNNIITVALALGEVEFAQSFSEGHRERIVPEIRNDIVLYNQAKIEFASGDFEAALRLIQQVTYLDSLITFGLKRLQIMCFYEQKDVDAFTNALNTFAVFLHRLEENQSPVIKKKNSNFLKHIRLLCKKLDNKWTDDVKAEYTASIRKDSFTLEREWLEAKL